jgi:SdrD B-like domain
MTICVSNLLSSARRLLALGAASVLLLPAVASAQLTGAVYTSNFDATIVNENIYTLKANVYLSGGPQNQNGPGLPNGTYYFQVTDPSGATLLSTDNAVCRQVLVQGGRIYGVAPAAVNALCAHANGTFNSSNGQWPVQLIPFNTTPNNGGEYKLWLIAQTAATSIDAIDPKKLIFDNRDTKTDNFKVKEGLPPGELFAISGYKFYDANLNGTFDTGEEGIPFFKIELFGDQSSNTTTVLSPRGKYTSFVNLLAGTYGVCEVVPKGGQTWISTTPTSIYPITVGPNSENNNFGNVCLGAGNGRTLGFWSNKNGQAALDKTSWITVLTSLNLRTASGGDFTPASYKDFRSWLLSATATNMAYMLSAQLSAMVLNVNYGGPDGKVAASAFVYAGAAPANCTVGGLSSAGFIKIADLISAANSSLGANGYTVAAGDVRNCQEFLKNALDKGNNNLNFVQPAGACQVVYSGTEAKCSP